MSRLVNPLFVDSTLFKRINFLPKIRRLEVGSKELETGRLGAVG